MTNFMNSLDSLSFKETFTNPTKIFTIAITALLSYTVLKKLFSKKGIKIQKDTLVLITGASQGIGAQLAIDIAKRGAKVILLARNEENLRKVKDQTNSENVYYFPCDCSNEEQVYALAEKIKKEIGLPDIIVNSAGAGRWRALVETEKGEIQSCINAPYLAAAYVTKAFLKEMIERNSGAIVNIQSAAAFTYFGYATAYGAARYALRGFTEFLRGDLFDTNLKVFQITFGETQSEYFKNNPGSNEKIPKVAKWFIPTITTKEASNAIIYAIENNKLEYFYPKMARVCMHLNSWMPRTFGWLCTITGFRKK